MRRETSAWNWKVSPAAAGELEMGGIERERGRGREGEGEGREREREGEGEGRERKREEVERREGGKF
jgi:hypothetical protein